MKDNIKISSEHENGLMWPIKGKEFHDWMNNY
jgi:hypothetical protein